jgi:pimeloyl-ACP methyl ester carboxylesterase
VSAVGPAASPRVIELRCPVGELGAPLAPEDGLEIAVTVFVPDAVGAAPVVLCCLPGGGLGRGYYDLATEGDESFSFARRLCARGFVVVTADMIGAGASSRPADGFGITPDIIAAANAQAVEHVLECLRAGRLDPTVAAMPRLVPVGVGHSLGAVCSIVQQAHHGQYRALVLLGFGGAGFPSELNPEELALAGDPQALRANVVRLARARYPEPYWRLVGNARTREVYGSDGHKPVMGALRAAGTVLLATAGLYSMIPGSIAAEAAAIDVPVFLGIGDRDICGPPHAVPAVFLRSADVTLVVMPATGHTHFVFSSVHALFARIDAWVGTVLPREE